MEPQLDEQPQQLPQLELEQPQQLEVEQLDQARASDSESCAMSLISKVLASSSAICAERTFIVRASFLTITLSLTWNCSYNSSSNNRTRSNMSRWMLSSTRNWWRWKQQDSIRLLQ